MVGLGRHAGKPRLDRGELARHFALLAAAVAVFGFEAPLASGNAVLWIIAAAAGVNLAGSLIGRPGWRGRILDLAGPFLSLGAWTALAYLSGGARSPFIAGFWVELILSVRARSRVGPIPIGLTSAGLLWFHQSLLGIGENLPVLLLETGFLAFMGFATWYLKHSWQRDRAQEDRTRSELELRLVSLGEELDDVRTLGRLGESTARLAHGLKNALHSLRGFVGLMEQFDEPSVRLRAMAGLKMAIDDLDSLARTTLAIEPARTLPGEVPRVIRSAVREACLSASRPECALVVDPPPSALLVSPLELKEVVSELLRNAIEATVNEGVIELRASPSHNAYVIRVRDHGSGLDHVDPERLFQPAYTTKPEGSGFGLYLARSLLRSAGGALSASSAPDHGAVFTARVPMFGEEA